MKNNKGFTVFELLVGFLFLIVIGYFLLTTMFGVRDKQQLNVIKSKLVDYKTSVTSDIEMDLMKYRFISQVTCGTNCIDITFANNIVKRLSVDTTLNKITYGDSEYELIEDSYFVTPFTFTTEVVNGTYNRKNAVFKINIPIEHTDVKGSYGINIVYPYNTNDTASSVSITLVGSNPLSINKDATYIEYGATASSPTDGDITENITITNNVNTTVAGNYTVIYSVIDSVGLTTTATRTVIVIASEYVASKGVNKPKLITGMTPIKWNGSAWVDTTEGDAAWYDYSTGAKQWANAKTADGSMWVWIPRYAYQIATNYHTATVGTINIKFLKEKTNTASDDSTVVSTPTYGGSNQTNYILHPAFTFGAAELTGIWVAKFEASVANTGDLCYTSASVVNCDKTTLIPKIVPNVSSWRYISIGNMFTVTRSMETNNTYGWGTTGTELDTHLMKNIEWGAVTYLSQSTYGKNSEIWINNSGTYTTGCAGSSVSAGSYAGCQNAYSTATGFNASTTGNIYGIYDISGGAWEYTSAYVNNGNANLTTNGNSIIIAASKYKDIYTVTTDSDINNYNNASSMKGDAVYETSSTYTGTTSWNSDNSVMSNGTYPWFSRGGSSAEMTGAGAFAFYYSSCAPSSGVSTFRVVLGPKG